MSHSAIRVFIHYCWTTKRFQRIFTNVQRAQVHAHMAWYARENGVVIRALNIQPEHVHALVALTRSQRVEDIPRLLKGETSHWINDTRLTRVRFVWQSGYWAESVDPKRMNGLVYYIEHQDEHHERESYANEYTRWLLENGYSQMEVDELIKAQTRIPTT